MTGPEHYAAAERILAGAGQLCEDLGWKAHGAAIAEAQVHATLALASATASAIPLEDPQGSNNSEIIDAWAKAGAW